ncbi:MAG: hypothetical protein ACI3W5_15620 [Faecousia sp.]
MKIYRQTRKDKVTAMQQTLMKYFYPSDTWGVIDTRTAPDRAESDFRAAILSDAAAKEQKAFEQLAQLFPDKYGDIVPAEGGKTVYSVFPAATGAKILFITDYAQKTVKKIFTCRTMGAGMKIHTGKVRNRFEPARWSRESWFFVAYALSTGNEKEFAPVSRYN